MLARLNRIWSLDQLIGPPLVTLIYYCGAAAIVLGALAWLMLGFMRLASDLGAGLVMLVAVPAVSAVLLLAWRFFCELCMIAFANHELLAEIRDRQRADYSQF